MESLTELKNTLEIQRSNVLASTYHGTTSARDSGDDGHGIPPSSVWFHRASPAPDNLMMHRGEVQAGGSGTRFGLAWARALLD